MSQLFGLSDQTWLYLDQFGILFGDIMLLARWTSPAARRQ
jgi:hypothetical protein